jgi:plastocyanin
MDCPATLYRDTRRRRTGAGRFGLLMLLPLTACGSTHLTPAATPHLAVDAPTDGASASLPSGDGTTGQAGSAPSPRRLSGTPAASAPRPGAAPVAVITLDHSACQPSTITVTVGTQVFVENHDSVPATWRSDQGYWNFTIAPGSRQGLDMMTAGTYPFHCDQTPGILRSQASSSNP